MFAFRDSPDNEYNLTLSVEDIEFLIVDDEPEEKEEKEKDEE